MIQHNSEYFEENCALEERTNLFGNSGRLIILLLEQSGNDEHSLSGNSDFSVSASLREAGTGAEVGVAAALEVFDDVIRLRAEHDKTGTSIMTFTRSEIELSFVSLLDDTGFSSEEVVDPEQQGRTLVGAMRVIGAVALDLGNFDTDFYALDVSSHPISVSV